ncbi:hypothetical protein HOD29_00105 [archaeon]|jgi:hypothetical protein|nr:hypothetical protein [archaeon]
MKKFIFFLILGVFFFSLVSAVDVEIKENYKLGETALMKVSGNFLEDITKTDIKFYRRHQITSFSDYDVFEIGDNYYIYFAIEMGKTADNYSVQISGVSYMKGVEVSEDTIIGEFKILDETADFSLTPGAGITSESLNVRIQNLKENKINVSVESGSYEFRSGDIKTFIFPVNGINETKVISFSSENQSYLLPLKLIYFGSEENQTEINESEGIIINETVDEDADGDILVNETANEGEEGDILVNQNQNESEDDEENRVNASKVMVEDEEGNIVSCADKLGKICLVDKEVCNGKTIVADNICCLGECVLKKEADNKKVIGWVLIIFLVLFLAWFFGKKYRGTKNTKGILGRK